jgi:Animal haem peroxidase
MSERISQKQHGTPPRGLSTEAIDQDNSGRFGRLFKAGQEQFPEAALEKLAEAMAAGIDPPKDGPDPEESHIPAAYTYFGQFIDHDLTFDPSTFQQQKHDPTGTIDFRTPRFDLDNLYGRGPSDQPFLYDGLKFLLGDKLFIAQRNPLAHDLPRSAASSAGIRRAIIGDPRNDENVIVSQFHGMMLRFHNRLVDLNRGKSFDEIQQEVRWHYQWLALHDFLTRIIDLEVLNSVSPAFVDTNKNLADVKLKLVPPSSSRTFMPFMPVEFSVAAYRLGHSMVRPGYRVNEFTEPLKIFDHSNPSNGLNAFGEFPKSWTIDWNRFVDVGLRSEPETKTDRVQLAYHIDTSIVEPLSRLPVSVAGDEAVKNPRLFSLAYRNLLRGNILRLPTGQEVAATVGVPSLSDDEILIGSAETGKGETANAPAIATLSPVFKGKTPLWTYVLAEARRNFFRGSKEARLGQVGGRIVAEVFLWLMLSDDTSYLRRNPTWRPTLGKNGKFTLPDLLLAALSE